MKYIFNRCLLLIIFVAFAAGCVSTSISAVAEDKSRNVDPELSGTMTYLTGGVLKEPTNRESAETLSSAYAASAETGNDDTAEETEGDAQRWLDEALRVNEESQKLWGEGDVDNSLRALDRAYGFILKVDTENNPDLSQQVDDLRFVISKRILEIYASRYISVQGNHKAIPLDMNRHIEREIRLFQEEKREFF